MPLPQPADSLTTKTLSLEACWHRSQVIALQGKILRFKPASFFVSLAKNVDYAKLLKRRKKHFCLEI
jgi:hypothetical protein